MTTRHRYMPLRDRLDAASERDKETGCLLWTGGRVSSGYGSVKRDGVQTPAHVASYEEHVGPIPDGLVIDHLCRTPACIEPTHLEPVTQRENTLRGVGPTAEQAKQTHCKRGHEFTDENTYTGGTPAGRRCKQCRSDQSRIRRGALHLVSDLSLYR